MILLNYSESFYIWGFSGWGELRLLEISLKLNAAYCQLRNSNFKHRMSIFIRTNNASRFYIKCVSEFNRCLPPVCSLVSVNHESITGSHWWGLCHALFQNMWCPHNEKLTYVHFICSVMSYYNLDLGLHDYQLSQYW